MKKDSIVARRAAETISLTDLHRVYDPTQPDLSLGGELDDSDRLSKGSECCNAEVYTSDGTTFCSKCGESTQEQIEDDDEYLERIAEEQAQKEDRLDFYESAFEEEEEGGY